MEPATLTSPLVLVGTLLAWTALGPRSDDPNPARVPVDPSVPGARTVAHDASGTAATDDVAEAGGPVADAPDYLRDVQPILAEACYACHGPDEAVREARLRLDRREGLFGERKYGTPVVAGDLDASVLWERVTDPDDPMPPADHLRQLEAEEREVLRRWIEAGAPFDEHWAFRPVSADAAPELTDDAWSRGEIDRHVLGRLRAEGQEPAPRADAVARLRRVTLDLTGLPPTPEELDAFLADPSDEAYAAAVDRLLASDAYAEQQARYWLDVARYADSNGDGGDGSREMWRWRDWVIEAFRENVPYDRFVTEQLAGDLLPDATQDQRLATGFLRNHPIFTKGGALEDEYRHAYVVDRVNTVGTAFLGLTLGCAQCHDHKYDPISQREYFGMFDFFNHASERDVGRRGNTRPVMHLPQGEDEARLEAARTRLAELEAELDGPNEAWDAAFEDWAEAQLDRARWTPEWRVLEPDGMMSLGGARLTLQDDGSVLAEGWNPGSDTYHLVLRPGKGTLTALRLEVLPDPSNPLGGAGRSDRGTFALGELEVYVCTEASGDAGDRVRFERGEDDVALERSNPGDAAVDGSARSAWSLFTEEGAEEHEAVFLPEEPIELNEHSILRVVFDHSSSTRRQRQALGRFRLSATSDETLRRRLMPIEAEHWQALGPFPDAGVAEAHAKAFEPEGTIPGGVDLDAEYEAPKPPRKGKGGPGGGGPKGGSDAEDGERGRGDDRGAAPGEDAPRGKPGENGPPKGDGKPGAKSGGKSGAKPDGKPDGKPSGEPGAMPAEGAAAKPKPKPEPKPDEDDGGADEGPDLEAIFGDDVPEEFAAQAGRRRRDGKLRWDEKDDWRDGTSFRLDGSNASWYLQRELEAFEDRRVRLWVDGGDALKVWLDGELVHEREHVEPPKSEDDEGDSGGGGFFGFFGGGFSDPDFDPDPKDPDGRSRYPVRYGDGAVLELDAGEHELVLKVTSKGRASVRVRIDPLGEDFLPLSVARAIREHFEPAAAADSGSPDDPRARPVAREADEATDEATDEALPEWAQVDYPDPRRARAEGLRTWFRTHALPEAEERVLERARLTDQRLAILGRSPTVMVMNDDRPRTTHLLVRGSWDQPGEVVEAHTPSILPPLRGTGEERPTRLDLARWLTSPEHPLTARVAVNRFWAQHFGRGLVGSPGDFGVRGERPTHPELLDHLAHAFVEGGWDVRALHRAIVLSETYQQSSAARPELLERDPDNTLLARMPRRRLAAEGVRDHALAASGLLHAELGGPSVRPPQPAGLWESIGKDGGRYRTSKGEDQYRRGLYVFWKRGVLYPSFSLFDAPSRTVCTVERFESNTPLQALVLLNDPVFVEAGRALGERMLDEGGTSDGVRLAHGFRLATSRLPEPREMGPLLRTLMRQRAHWAEHADEAKTYLAVGQKDLPEDADLPELAAWAAMGQLLLNLDAALHLD